jgi:hypothetical protein
MTTLRIPYIDYSNEGSTVSVPVLTAKTPAELIPLQAAIVALTYEGDQEALRIGEDAVAGSNTGKSTIAESQREKKWLLRFHRASDASKAYTREVPCADLNELSTDGQFIDLSAGNGLTLKTQFEILAADPDDESAVVLDSVEFVGRNI